MKLPRPQNSPVCLAAIMFGLAKVNLSVWSAVLIDFEGLPDSTPISATYAAQGVTFANATAITAGVSLNELEFPPSSGTVAVVDDGGPIEGTFATPVASFEARFTYVVPLTITAYQGATQVGEVFSLYGWNYVSSGNPPNELIGVSFPGGITRFTIMGDPLLGNSFVMDDFSFIPIPEVNPALMAALLLTGAGAYRLGRGGRPHGARIPDRQR